MSTLFKTALVMAGLALPVIFFWHDIQTISGNGGTTTIEAAALNGDEPGQKKKDKKKKKDEDKDKIDAAAANDDAIAVVEKWELPANLTEISGIAYLDNNRFACVQDELGTIFIYNTATKKVEKEIPFAGPGDYEGIALAGTSLYVLRADGKLFEVSDYTSGKPAVQQYSTPLTVKHDVEGLCYDARNNRLLLAIKENEPSNADYKGIYAFNLSNKKMADQPAYKVDLNNEIFASNKGKKKGGEIKPSDLDIHPTTGDLYITDGANRSLLVMDAAGNKKDFFQLSKNDFEQPEGIVFTPSGELYISNEGGKGKGNILKVEIAAQP